MKPKILTIVDKVIFSTFLLLFFLTPLVMIPFNYELFEFNKMLFVYLLTAVVVTAWLVKMVIAQKPLFRRTFLDIPLLLFLASQILSFLFSIDRHTSFWGYYSRFHGSLLSTISYLLLYWALVSNLDKPKIKKILWAILISAVLVATYGILEHFGIDAQYWVQDVQNRVFSSLGQPNWLAAYLAALIFLPLALKGKWSLTTRTGLMALLYLCLLYTKSRSGLLGFGIAYLFYWGWLLHPKLFRSSHWPRFARITALLLLMTLFIGSPWTRSLSEIGQESTSVEETSPISTGGTESGEIRKIVWQGAIEVWKHYPLFGTGVETFAYSYYWYRPREHNDVSEWDFLYNKAHNEYLNFAATTGTIGLLAYLGVIASFSLWSLKRLKKQKDQLHLALLAGYCSILVTNFFGFSVVNVGLFFFLFPAMALVLVEKPVEVKIIIPKKLNRQQQILLVLIALLFFSSVYKLGKVWAADTLFAKGEKLNQAKEYDEAFNTLQRAVKMRSTEPFFYDELSLAAANLGLAEIAINASNQALQISPYHVNFWKNRTRVFYTLAEADEQYNQNALDSLLTAQELAPTDAKISYNLGLMYGQLGQLETAIETLEETIRLKPNYENARYALALFYEQKGRREEAKEQLEYILEKINPENEEVKRKLEVL